MKLTRTMPDGSSLAIDANISRGYFSVTADWPSQRAGGCLHTECLTAAPWLAPIVALHLSDAQTGTPMHAEANGWYWVAGALGGLGQAHHGSNDGRHTAADCEHILAEHARVSLNEARGLVTAVDLFRAWIAAQAPRWAEEAARGRELLASKAAQYAAAGVQQ
jgi:hypothetical protein